MALLDRSQIDWLNDGYIGISNFSANGASGTVTTPITTALNTAGLGGVNVPLQVATASAPGVITAAGANRITLVNNTTKRPIADGSGNEVYARLTEAAGVYTLTYFVLVAGVETAFSFGSATAIDFYFAYRFTAATLPTNFAIALLTAIVQQDPSAIAGASVRSEKLNVTALNTLSALSQAPSGTTNIFLLVNGKIENPFGGANAAFSVSGTAVTWTPANAGYPLKTTMDVIAYSW